MKWWVIAAALIVVIGLLTVIVLFFMRPLAFNAFMERRKMKKAGLTEMFVNTSVGKIHVYTGGSGHPIVFLHGAGDQAGVWNLAAESLISGYKIIVPDLPGHGNSEPVGGPLTMDILFTGVQEAIDCISPEEPVIIIGNSLGAWIATLTAYHHNERVARLILINGGAVRGDYSGPGLNPNTVAEARTLMETLMGPAGALIPDFILKDVIRAGKEGPLPRVMAGSSSMADYILDGKINEITVPVTLLWGDSDGMMTIDYASRLLDEFPNAELVPLEGCGHVPMRQCPTLFIKKLLDIFDKESKSESSSIDAENRQGE